MKQFDLLTTIEYGGCSAKLPAKELDKTLAGLPKTPHSNLLVGTETHDDAGVFKISDEIALIQTTDFFPPVCSDPYEFGQIAAANALSDVYAMGGEALTALNLVCFPANIPLEVLKEILRGGIDKVKESGGVIAGGHTIVDDTPKYGLAVTGKVHPDKIITNAAAQPGDVLILTKPIGAGTIMAGHRIGEVDEKRYQAVLESMMQLNKKGAEIMQQFGVRCATDITGFGLAGHALKMAMGSKVTIEIEAEKVPLFDGAYDLIDLGCIPGACFRNLEYVEDHCVFNESLDYNLKMLMLDAQTSGGLLICCQEKKAMKMMHELKQVGFSKSAVIGTVKTNTATYNSTLEFV
ncbi:MAG: selenide, water dikinase SelD [Bacteroidales bacterium]|nr:selenide, water dikinase SelD [Bacteroidales bacterium]